MSSASPTPLEAKSTSGDPNPDPTGTGQAADPAPGADPGSPPPEASTPPKPDAEQVRYWRKEAPREILRKYLTDSFNGPEELRTFCSWHFELFSKEVRESDGFDDTIVKLIRYYKARGRLEELWVCLSKERPHLQDRYLARWQQALRNERGEDHKRQRLGDDDIDEYRHAASSALASSPKRAGGSARQCTLASGDDAAISDWFLNDLTLSDQGLVLGTALFLGLNREYLVQASRDLELILKADVDAEADRTEAGE
jgi:hypothetical protein